MKNMLLGEVGTGILLIIIGLLNADFSGNIPYIIGRNFLIIIGVLSIIDGIRKNKNNDSKKSKKISLVEIFIIFIIVCLGITVITMLLNK